MLADCPDILEAAVVGVEDPKWGEAACACVVTKLPETEILSLFEERLARYKHPRRIAYFDALPRNAMGKVLKSELKAALASRGEGKR
ncbi:Long-chain-fatty-acid--CoA ligase FadD13 [compost metagenome]